MKILYALIGVAVVLIVLGSAIPVLWPLAAGSADNISAMTGTDAGTTTIKAFWPIILLIIGLGIAIGLIIYGLKKFGMMGGGGLAFVPFMPVSVSVPYEYTLMTIGIAALTYCLMLRFGRNRKFNLFRTG